jgi:hypothetical protein
VGANVPLEVSQLGEGLAAGSAKLLSFSGVVGLVELVVFGVCEGESIAQAHTHTHTPSLSVQTAKTS